MSMRTPAGFLSFRELPRFHPLHSTPNPPPEARPNRAGTAPPPFFRQVRLREASVQARQGEVKEEGRLDRDSTCGGGGAGEFGNFCMVTQTATLVWDLSAEEVNK